MTALFNTQAPALPILSGAPSEGFQNTYSNVLRLYFNQVDNFTTTVAGRLGMSYLNAPYIAASDSTDQYADGDDDPTIIKWDSADAINGFVLNNDGTATVKIEGVYKIDYSIQFANSSNAAHDAFVWLQENGTPIPKSSSKFTLPAAKNATTPAYVVGYSSIVFEATPEDKIGLWWATDLAATSDGVTKGIYIEHLPAQTTPYIRPANPSVIGSITFVSRILKLPDSP